MFWVNEFRGRFVRLLDPAKQAMGGARRRQALRPPRRTSAQGEGVVGDLGDGEATVAGRGDEFGDPLLDRSRPLAH
jgi:hypothetical protein